MYPSTTASPHPAMQHNLWLFLAKISTRCNEKTENLMNIKGGDLKLDFCLHLKTMAPVIAVKQGPSDPNIKSDAGAIIYLYVNISFCYLFYHSWPHFSFLSISHPLVIVTYSHASFLLSQKHCFCCSWWLPFRL